MFELFDGLFRPDGHTVGNLGSRSDLRACDPTVLDICENRGGVSFNGGLYRIVRLAEIEFWNEHARRAFPSTAGKLSCFAVDWLGRIFAARADEMVDGKPAVLMLDAGTGEMLKIPCNVECFHDSELLEYSDEALAVNYYKMWLESGGSEVEFSQCIGYIKPLFLGGLDNFKNMERCDSDVYWTVNGQIISRIWG